MSTEAKTESPKITAYLKTHCGWSEGVRAIFRKYQLDFEEKDIIQNPAFRWEMEQKSGQPLSPCVEVNGTMLPDVSGEEVEAWMVKDPIDRMIAHLQGQQGQLNEAEWAAMDTEVMDKVQAAVAFAKASPVPSVETVADDIFAD